MTESELKELEELRTFKRMHTGLEQSFRQLELLIHSPHVLRTDGVMSVRAVKVIADCLFEMKKVVCK